MLTVSQVDEAIAQMVVHTTIIEEQGYEMLSARGVLMQLGYEEHVDQVLASIAERGFDYCLDSTIAHNGVRPIQDVCHWGPDQLRSRLECLHYLPEAS